jgi:hypothetical protein
MKVPSSRRSITVNVGDVAESVDELGEGEARGGVGVKERVARCEVGERVGVRAARERR